MSLRSDFEDEDTLVDAVAQLPMVKMREADVAAEVELLTGSVDYLAMELRALAASVGS